MHVLPRRPFASPAQAREAALPVARVDRSVPFGRCLVAPAAFAVRNRTKLQQ